MKIECFTIPALHHQPHLEELNQFLANHRVLAIDKQLVVDGQQSFWCFCITYVTTRSGPPGKPSKIDYREQLSPERFGVFSKLRTLRKNMAQEAGIPPYAVFTNEQLAAMTAWDHPSLQDMAGLPGVGKARIEKFGTQFLDLLLQE